MFIECRSVSVLYRLYRPPQERAEAKVRFGIVKAFEMGYRKDKELPEVKKLFQNVEEYRKLLRGMVVGVGLCCGWYPNAVGHGRAIHQSPRCARHNAWAG